MPDSIAQASNIANVVVAIANLVLVIFLFWQISLQKRFFIEQARRDAAQKISESYQRLSSTFMGNRSAAALFYQTHDSLDAQKRASWAFVLNTLHHEYRFARQGLHPLENLKRTAKGYIGFITDTDFLSDTLILILNTGYDKDFSELMKEIIKERHQQLVSASAKTSAETVSQL
jgi:hypothetical protein